LLLKCKTPHFSISFSVEFEIAGYYILGWLWHAGSHDINLSYHMQISMYFALCDLQTLQTEGHHAVMLCVCVLSYMTFNIKV